VTSDLMLVVDDSKLARMMIKGFVSEAYPEMKFIEAANGDEALELSKEKPITIMTIDYNMPGINGLELAEILKASNPDAHISLITANVQNAIKERTENLGIEFVSKPINETKLINFINSRNQVHE